VTGVSSSCSQARTLTVDLDISLSDGRSLDFGGDSWPETERSYHAIGALRAAAPYDNSGASDCPPELRILFAGPSPPG